MPVELGPRKSISTFDHWTTAPAIKVGEEAGVIVGGGRVLVAVGGAAVEVSEAVGVAVDSGVGEGVEVGVKLGDGVAVDVGTVVAEGSGDAVGRSVAVNVGDAVLDGMTVAVAGGERKIFTVS